MIVEGSINLKARWLDWAHPRNNEWGRESMWHTDASAPHAPHHLDCKWRERRESQVTYNTTARKIWATFALFLVSALAALFLAPVSWKTFSPSLTITVESESAYSAKSTFLRECFSSLNFFINSQMRLYFFHLRHPTSTWKSLEPFHRA